MRTSRRTPPTRPRSRAVALLAPLALALALTASGCGPAAPAASPASPGGTGQADRIEPLAARDQARPALPVTVASADGRRVTVTSTERIVPLSGSLSELVFSLGLGGQVVARDVTATFEQAARLPVVTRAHDVSAESVLSLRPTLVLAESTTGPAEAVARIREAGVPLLVVAPAKGLADVPARIGAVSAALGVPGAGDALARRTEARLDAVRRTVPARPEKPRVAFLYVRGSAAVYLLGGADSGASSLLEAAGAVDAGKESGLTKDFTPLTSEALAAAAPDAILVMRKGLDSVGGVDGLVRLPGVAETPAGQDRRIVSVDDGVLLTYGPRTDRVLETLIDQLYGEAK
ncbi:ABC transporter substrate-binding protein [Streptomyces sp. NPDC048659]|uniref:heme/hemin ABC transporter substrate-binding protein n=1 Tax=Streptomyces sp. NPDC048659 TaxID=3155489 RepID=UPI003446F329